MSVCVTETEGQRQREGWDCCCSRNGWECTWEHILNSSHLPPLCLSGLLLLLKSFHAFHRVMEQLRLQGTFQDHLIWPLHNAGTARAGCSGPHPAGFWVLPRTETPQPPWATCSSVQSPFCSNLCKTCFDIRANNTGKKKQSISFWWPPCSATKGGCKAGGVKIPTGSN